MREKEKRAAQKNGFKAFRPLHWRLARSYMFISMAAWLLMELLLLIVLIWGVYFFHTFLLASALESNANVAPSLLVGDHGPDQRGLALWLQQQQRTVDKVFSYTGTLAVVDRQGRAMISTGAGTHHLPPGILFSSVLSNQDALLLHTSLNTRTNGKTITHESAATDVLILVPLEEPDKQLDGLLVFHATNLNIRTSLVSGIVITFLLPASIVIVLCVGAAGAIFGAVTSRSLIRRFNNLAEAADHWSRGDFSALVNDPMGDEIGRVTRGLNRMAEQLQHLVQVRQEQAALDERGRMARDLHDSIKQQVFALFMQITGAKALLFQGKDGAQVRLEQAESLLGQMQDDLTNLIRELRPAMLEGRRFLQALREQVEQWAQQTGIEANFQVDGMHAIPMALEDALYRLTQEALSNVARHSHASSVHIHLILQQDATILKITDNGRGCNVSSKIGKGIGLLSMSERLLPFGGVVDYQSKPEQGFVVIATVSGADQLQDGAHNTLGACEKGIQA
ncbi:MAG TPA: sensor histidine kinase [Ktedonobacteraceae bacterium]|nr:sensor histidine kinase [Ktedonobacteraceae bacterium]